MDNLIKGAVNKIKQFATNTFKAAAPVVSNFNTQMGNAYKNFAITPQKIQQAQTFFSPSSNIRSMAGQDLNPNWNKMNFLEKGTKLAETASSALGPVMPNIPAVIKTWNPMNKIQEERAVNIEKQIQESPLLKGNKILADTQRAMNTYLTGGILFSNPGEARNFSKVDLNKAFHPEDTQVMKDFATIVDKLGKKANKTELGELGLNADRVLERYFGNKFRGLSNTQIKQMFDYTLAKMESGKGGDALIVKPKGFSLPVGLQTQEAEGLAQQSQKVKVINGKIKVTPNTPELTQPKINAAEKLRGYVESIQTNKKTPSQLTSQFEGMSNTTYVPKSNDKLSLFAKTLVKRDVASAEKYVAEHFDDQAVATSHQLIDYYSKLKNFDRAAEIAVNTAEKLTEAGRTVQAASLYNKLGPSGIQRYAATQLSKFKQQLKPEDAKRLYEMSLLIQKMPDGDAKLLEQQKLMEEVGKLIPTPFLRKTITLWKANLLTGLKTTIRNVTSNTANFASETVKDVPATMTDIISSLFTGKRTKTFTLRGIGSGSIEGTKEGWKLLTTGVDSRKSLGKMDVTPINWGNNPVQKAAKVYTDTIFRFLGAQDKPFYYARLKQSLFDQAGAEAVNVGQSGNQQFIKNLVNNPTEQMIKTAVHDAEMAVFQQKTKLGSVINAAKRAVESDAKKGNLGSAILSAIGEFTVPFTGVPSGVASQLVNYSPVGLAKTIIENIGKGKFDQRAFSEGIGRGLTGTGIMAIGAELAKKDLITLEYPTDAKEQQQWELEGKKPYSILWDGKWRSIGSLGSQAQAILTGAAYAKKGVSGAAIGALKSQAEQTFLKGVSSLTEAIVDPTKKGMAYVGNIVGGFVPTIVSDIGRATDTSQREINKTNDIKYLEDTIKSRIPIIRQELLPKRNAFGEVIQTEPSGIGQMIDIFNSSQAKTSPLIQELRRLLDIEEGATPTKIPTTQSVGGQKIKLSFELQDLLESKSGPVVKRIMEETISTPQYQALTDDKRQQLLQKIINDVRGVEKLKVISGAKLNPEATAKAALDLTKNQQNYLMTGNLPLNYPSVPKTGTIPTTQTEAMNRILTGQTTAPGQIATTLGGVKFAQPTTELGKMELSKQIGNITTQINDIYDMYKMGAISEQDANNQISQLKAQQTALRKLMPKTGKAKIAKVSLRKVSKGRTAKLKTIKFKTPKLKTIAKKTFKVIKFKQPKIKVKMPRLA